jgi:hypothetical protein
LRTGWGAALRCAVLSATMPCIGPLRTVVPPNPSRNCGQSSPRLAPPQMCRDLPCPDAPAGRCRSAMRKVDGMATPPGAEENLSRHGWCGMGFASSCDRSRRAPANTPVHIFTAQGNPNAHPASTDAK